MFLRGSMLSITLRSLRSSLGVVFNMDQCVKPITAFRPFSVGRTWSPKSIFNIGTHRLHPQMYSDVGYNRPKTALPREIPQKSHFYDRSTKRLLAELEQMIDSHVKATSEAFSAARIETLLARARAALNSPQHHLDCTYGQLRSAIPTLDASALLDVLTAHVRHKKAMPQALLNDLYRAMDAKIDKFSGGQLVEVLHCLASLKVPFISQTWLDNHFDALENKCEGLDSTQLMNIVAAILSLAENEGMRDTVGVGSYLLRGFWCNMAIAKRESFSAHQLVSYLHATSRLKISPREELLEAFYLNNSKKMESLTEEQLTVVWTAFARGFEKHPYSRPAPQAFITAFEGVVTNKISSFSGQSLFILIDGYAKLGVKPPERLLEMWFDCATSEKLSELSSRDLTVLQDSREKLKLEHETFDRVYVEVVQSNLADTILAFSDREDEQDDPSRQLSKPFLDIWHEAALMALPSLDGRDLANIIEAYSCARQYDPLPAFLSKFCEQVPSKFGEMSASQLLMVLSGFRAVLEYRDASEDQFKEVYAQFQGAFMQRWYEAAVEKMTTRWSRDDLCAVVSALGALNLNPPQAFIDAFMAFTHVKLDLFSPGNVGDSMEALAKLGIKPSDAFMERMCARVCQLSFHKFYLLQLLGALNQLNHACDDLLLEKLTTSVLSAAAADELSGNEAKEMLRLCLHLAVTSHDHASDEVRQSCTARLCTKEDIMFPRLRPRNAEKRLRLRT